MSAMEQGGAIATSSGKVLESTVEAVISAKGLKIVNYLKWIKNKGAYGEELLIKNMPFTSIYKHESKTEFLLRSKKYQITARIECKWQQAAGSVDEKFPYLFFNYARQVNEPLVIILLDGGGAKKGAVTWLKGACAQFNLEQKLTTKRRLEIMNMMDFMRWVNLVFKTSG